jgi:hypothetical protein
MTKRPTLTGDGQERLRCGGSESGSRPRPVTSGVFPAQIIGATRMGPGHQIHWIHFNHSMREPSAVIPVTAEVDEDGLVHIEGDDVSLVRWNHRPALLWDALRRFGGMAVWKRRWYILAVPDEAFFGGARSVFSLAAPDERRECYVHRATNPDHLVPCAPYPTNGPPVQIAARYAAERRRPNRNLRN